MRAETRLASAVGLRCGLREQRGADAAGDGHHARGVGRDVFDGGEGEVDGGAGGAGLVPLVGIGVGSSVRRVVSALRGGQRADADDAGLGRCG